MNREERYNNFINSLQGRAEKVLQEMDRIQSLMGDTNKINIHESSLSRVWKYTQSNDIGIITAFRGEMVNCLFQQGDYDGESSRKISKDENLERNSDLLATLLYKKYGVTKVKGSYIENFETPTAVEKNEESFFVVNRNDDPEFFETLIKLGRVFCQDSVLFKPKGEDAFLYGTNNNEFPGLDNKIPLGKFIGSKEGEFMTRVGKSDRSFMFMEDYQINSKLIITRKAKKVLGNL